MKTNNTLSVIMNEIEHIKTDIGEIKKILSGMSQQYVSQAEYKLFKENDFGLIKRAVLGMAGMILLGFLGFLISLAFK